MRERESLDNLGYSQPASAGLPGLWGNFNWVLASPHYYDPEDCDDSLEPPHAADPDGVGEVGADERPLDEGETAYINVVVGEIAFILELVEEALTPP